MSSAHQKLPLRGRNDYRCAVTDTRVLLEGVARLTTRHKYCTRLVSGSYDRRVDHPLYIPTPPDRVTRRQPAGWGTMLHRPLHQSITEIGEHDFVAMLLKDLHYRNTYL